MQKDVFLKFLLFFCSLLVCAVASEFGVRYLGNFDSDGNFIIRSRMLKPYRLPVNRAQQTIDEYLTSTSEAILNYDPALGWSPTPNGKSEDNLYQYNSSGIRSAPTEYSMTPDDGVVRIALFGDSFTHGDEVPYEETWGNYLENNLSETGVDVEVVNFGVMGYGMDQAFLRWKKLGSNFSSHIILFGLQLENVNRNLNLIRPLYHFRTIIPFSKPRFIMHGDGPELINVPTIAPERVPLVLGTIEAWQFVEYEHFYSSEKIQALFQDRIWLRSKFVSLVSEILSPSSLVYQPLYDPEDEPALLTLRIIEAFKKDVEERGAIFLIVSLPQKGVLINLFDGEELASSQLLVRIEQNHRVIHPESDFLSLMETSPVDRFFRPNGHYSQAGNEVIADAITEFMMEHDTVLQ